MAISHSEIWHKVLCDTELLPLKHIQWALNGNLHQIQIVNILPDALELELFFKHTVNKTTSLTPGVSFW